MSKYTKLHKPVNARQKPAKPAKKPRKIDRRKQLFNDRKCGPVTKIQLPEEMITRLWGILLDIDPRLFRKAAVPADARDKPKQFYQNVVRPWLSRHPVLRDAEVVLTGTGLHVIIWFAEAVEFTSDAERQRWAGIVKAIQALVPSDPDAPGITALTRARGSVNSKNGATVKQLHAGKPVAVENVLELFEQLRQKPFHTLMTILFGTDRLKPCPVCREEVSTLTALDRAGRCYGSCGKVPLAKLYDVFLKPRPAPDKEA